LRFGKLLQVDRARAIANVDLCNALNANTIQTEG
jgi:hypothetical protein